MRNAHKHILIRRTVQDIWNEGHVDVADDLFAKDYVNHGGLIPDIVSGPEAIKMSVVLYRRAFPWLHISVDELQTVGEIVVLSWTARNDRPPDVGLHDGLPAQENYLTGTTCIRCVDGKIAESCTSWDKRSLSVPFDRHLAA